MVRILGFKPGLLHFLDVWQRPALVEVCFHRPVKTEIGEPRLAGNGRNPVLLKTCGSSRAKINVHAAIVVFAQIHSRRTIGNFLLVFNEGPRVQIVERHGQEVLRRRVRRDVQAVGFGAVESMAVFVSIGCEIRLTYAWRFVTMPFDVPVAS